MTFPIAAHWHPCFLSLAPAFLCTVCIGVAFFSSLKASHSALAQSLCTGHLCLYWSPASLCLATAHTHTYRGVPYAPNIFLHRILFHLNIYYSLQLETLYLII